MPDRCPWCDNPLKLSAAKRGGVSKSTRTGPQWHGQSYRTQVEALGPQSPSLGPGQVARFETPIRAQDVEADVTVPFLQAAGYGVGASLVSILPAVFLPGVPWYTPLLVLPTVTGCAMFVTPAKARKLLMRVEEWTGQDIDGDGQIGDIAVDLNADLDTGPGGTQKTRVTIPLRMVRNWRWFCRDVLAKECNFSGTAAKAHGLDPVWFKEKVIAQWAGSDPTRALVDPETTGHRKTPQPTPLGWERIEMDARSTLSALIPLLERLAVADR